MTRIEKDKEREDRIHNEAIVDAHGPEEQAVGWYYYLADAISLPFQARCIQEIRKSPLKLNEIITVVDLIPDEESYAMLVEIKFKGRLMGVPLYQLHPIDVDVETQQVIEDWQYWIARGYQFG